MDRYTIEIEDSKIDSLDFNETKTHEGISLNLTSVCVDKEMYKPGCIKAEIKLTKSGEVTEADCSTIIEQLLGKRVSISGKFSSSTTSTKKYQVGTKYTIFNVQPRRVYSGGLQTILQIVMYGPDKYLDLRKYSKSYTAKCLGSNVIEDLLKELKEGDDKISLYCDYTHQQRMQAPCDNKDLVTYSSKVNGVTLKFIEGIQPYMVQYNETAHSFISRIANRCGEFFFYDDEKLVLGLDTNNSKAITQDPGSSYKNKINVLKATEVGQTTKIGTGDIADVTYNEFVIKDEYDAQCPNYTTQYKAKELPKRHIQKDSNGNCPHVQTYEGPSIEDLAGYSKEFKTDGAFNTFGKPKTWLQMIFWLLQKDTIVDMLGYLTENISFTAVLNSFNNMRLKSDFKEKFVSPYEKKENTKHNGKSQIYQFCLAEQYSVALSNIFYQLNKECAEVAKNSSITVKLRATSEKVLKLGNFVNIFGREYVVTKVHGEARKDVEIKDTDNWFEAVPALAVAQKGDNNKTVYKVRYAPASLPGGTKRTAAPQRAIVKDTTDPLSLGRVRILYPWQPDDVGEASPLIRVSQPYASAKSGIRFTPQVGDEIMVGYEFDDIERPFMMGAIATASTNGSRVDGNNNIICSPNGHQIKFSNPNSAKGFVEGFFPVFKSFTNMGIPILKNVIKSSPELGGSMTFTDTYGIYNVELSTDYRRIRIQSHLGNIEMSAMTGISINCPTGDVSIKGKNVTIEAGDKVTITSGKNIDTQKLYDLSKKENVSEEKRNNSFSGAVFGSLLNNIANDYRISDAIHINLVDLAALRAVLDGFVKPINGTLLIKSNRFMFLEAGTGKTYLRENLYRNDSHLAHKKTDKEEVKKGLQKNLKMYLDGVNNWYWAYYNLSTAIDSRKTEFINYLVTTKRCYKVVENITSPIGENEVRAKISSILADGPSSNQAMSKLGQYIDGLKLPPPQAQENNGAQPAPHELQNMGDADKNEAKDLAQNFLRTLYEFTLLLNDRANELIPTGVAAPAEGAPAQKGKYLDEIRTIFDNLVRRHKTNYIGGANCVIYWREFMYDVLHMLVDKNMIHIGDWPKTRREFLTKGKEIEWVDKGREKTCQSPEEWTNFLQKVEVRLDDDNSRTGSDFLAFTNVGKTIDSLDTFYETNALWGTTLAGGILMSDSFTHKGTLRVSDPGNDVGNGNDAHFKYDIPPTDTSMDDLRTNLGNVSRGEGNQPTNNIFNFNLDNREWFDAKAYREKVKRERKQQQQNNPPQEGQNDANNNNNGEVVNPPQP